MYGIKPTVKPAWFHFRTRLAFFLVRLASKIKPDNDAATAFWLSEIVNDSIINGKSHFKVTPIDILEENSQA